MEENRKKVPFYNQIEKYMIVSMFLVMTVIIALNVVTRFVFNFTLSWGEQLARLLLVWTSFAGISCGISPCDRCTCPCHSATACSAELFLSDSGAGHAESGNLHYLRSRTQLHWTGRAASDSGVGRTVKRIQVIHHQCAAYVPVSGSGNYDHSYGN